MWREAEQNGVSALILTGQWTLLRCISVTRRLQIYAQREISFEQHLDCPSSYTLGLTRQCKKEKKIVRQPLSKLNRMLILQSRLKII